MWAGRHHEDSSHTPAEVWDAVVAVHGGLKQAPGHEAYTCDGPLGPDAVVRAVHAGHPGPARAVVAFAPGRRPAPALGLRGYGVRRGYPVAPHGDGTRLVRTIEANGPIADLATAGLGQQLLALYKPQVRALLDFVAA